MDNALESPLSVGNQAFLDEDYPSAAQVQPVLYDICVSESEHILSIRQVFESTRSARSLNVSAVG